MSYQVEVVRNALIPTAGGELAADLFLPRGAPRAPAIVMLLPYNKDWAAGLQFWQSQHYLARHGYPCVLADFRGTGSSSGQARAPFDSAEADDGVATVRWAAEQDWCDGSVGMWGISYGGITSLRTASRRPPALKAIVSIMGHLDPERDFVHPSGMRGCLSPLGWATLNLLLQLMPPLHMDAEGRWWKIWEERLQHAKPYIMDLSSHPPQDPIWRSRVIDATKIAVPSLCVIGWRDLFVDGMLRAYEQIPVTKKLLAGPWMHALPHASPFGAIDFLPIMRRWWDRWLRGIKDAADQDPTVSVFVQGVNRWRAISAWPPVEGRVLSWYTSCEGALQREPVAAVGIAGRPPDATIGVGAGLANFHSFGYGMPVDQSDDDRRGLSFTSSKLQSPVSIMGRPRVRLNLDARVGCVVVKLADVHPDGRSVFIASGVAPLSAASPDGELWIELAPTSYEIAAGHQLRLMIANGDFPRLWPEPHLSEFLVRCGERLSELQLPVVPEDVGRELCLESADPRAEVPPQLLQAEPPKYEVVRDAAPDSVTVTVRTDELVRSSDSENTVRSQQMIVGSVSRAKPADARFVSTATARITAAEGVIEVDAKVTVTADCALAEGTVSVAGRTTFTRQWRA